VHYPGRIRAGVDVVGISVLEYGRHFRQALVAILSPAQVASITIVHVRPDRPQEIP